MIIKKNDDRDLLSTDVIGSSVARSKRWLVAIVRICHEKKTGERLTKMGISATWAANGVRINAVAPGNVHTAMTATMSTTAKMALNALPIPTKYGQECLMAPEEIAEVMVFLASDSARGVNGNIMFVDGGTDALLNTEKVY